MRQWRLLWEIEALLLSVLVGCSGTPSVFRVETGYVYLLRERKLVPLESGTALEGALTEEDQQWVNQYKAWRRSAHGVEGDCLGGALVAGKYLDLQGRYMWAMAMSKSPVR